MLFGLAPAVERVRGEALSGARATSGPRNWLRGSLLTVQIAVALLLLSGAGLLLTSLWQMQNTRLGFDTEHVVTASFTLPQQRYGDDPRQVSFFNELEQRMRQMPGAVATAITDTVPPGGDPRSVPYVALAKPGGSAAEQGMEGLVKWRYITPGYFDVLGIRIERGRGFLDVDRQPGEPPVVLSASLARRLFGAEDPVGKRLSTFAPLVIGVAADVRNAGITGAADPEFYHVRKVVPGGTYQNQRPPLGWRRATAMVRSSLPEKDAEELLRATIAAIDPSLPLEFETMNRQVDRYFTRPRFHTVLLSVFALAGLLLAAIGLYGLMSFLVAARTREIGVRMALGASPGSIARLVLSDGLRWIAAGVVLGAAASAGLLRLLQGLVYGVDVYDLRVFAGAVCVLALTAAAAAWFPGRRASRTQPIIALHHD